MFRVVLIVALALCLVSSALGAPEKTDPRPYYGFRGLIAQTVTVGSGANDSTIVALQPSGTGSVVVYSFDNDISLWWTSYPNTTIDNAIGSDSVRVPALTMWPIPVRIDTLIIRAANRDTATVTVMAVPHGSGHRGGDW